MNDQPDERNQTKSNGNTTIDEKEERKESKGKGDMNERNNGSEIYFGAKDHDGERAGEGAMDTDITTDPMKFKEKNKAMEGVEKSVEGAKESAGPEMDVKSNDGILFPGEKKNKTKTEATPNGTATSGGGKNGNTPPTTTAAATAAAAAAAAPPPPPVLRGTLSYNVENRRHIIRGMWNYENSNTLPPQRFELLRTLKDDEDVKGLPKDGEFHGSFSLAYFHTTSKGKQKERSRVIPESGVNIKFTKIEGKEGEYDVDGTGTNQFGVFNINGTATPSQHDGDPTYNVILRKRYKPSQAPPPEKKKNKTKKRKLSLVGSVEAVEETGPLPPPSESYPSHVVCLRGKLRCEETDNRGLTETVHRISGMWSSGLDLILADPNNEKGQCNKFEYEHKSSTPNKAFPISGRYSGWFDLTGEDHQKTRISEKDITLKFRKNNAGYYNVEGKGSNYFGKYSITGTMTLENVITIFRHFLPRKQKKSDPSKTPPAVTTAPPPLNAPGKVGKVDPAAAQPEPKLKLDEVIIPGPSKLGDGLDPIPPPAHGSYSAISRGILRLNDDGAHTCAGRWAMTREHFTNGTTSNFAFRLESHFAAKAADRMKGTNGQKTDGTAPVFPVDSEMYKGSFQMKRGASKHTSVIDQQIVLRFRKNASGSYNVYGKGINSIGTFNLVGTLIVTSGTSGHVELYRMYPVPPTSKAQPGAGGKGAPKLSATTAKAPALPARPSKESAGAVAKAPVPVSVPKPGPVRRESSRMVKLPSRLEEDDPKAQIVRLMDKCAQVLKFIKEKDVAAGAFFSNPVDPVAHEIPTYHQIIKEPMDLGTIQQKMDAGTVSTPEEFGRLTRLVFENAMTFNVEHTHVVHQAARQLLILFNQKFRDIQRMADNIRRQHKLPGSKKKGIKRKGEIEEPKSPKRQRLDRAQAMAESNASALAALAAAAPTGSTAAPVSRIEFNMMVQLIQQLQGQVVETMTMIANLSSDVVEESTPVAPAPVSMPQPTYAPLPEPILPVISEKKKPKKSVAEEKQIPPEEEKPLTLEEQERLTGTINDLPPDKLPGVIKIIRESANLADDEEEIDLEIDQLDTATQRKLQRYVMKHVKPKRTKAKSVPKKKPTKKAESRPKPIPKKADSPPRQKVSAQESFFAFGTREDDSDSDSEGEIKGPEAEKPTAPITSIKSEPDSVAAAAESTKEASFSLGVDDDDDDDDDADDIGGGGLGANWSMSKPLTTAASTDADDGDWGAAREEAEAAKQREAERKAREEKMRAEAEEAKNQRLADAAARGDQIRAQREEEAANELRMREQKEKEAEEKKKAARDAARAELQSVKQTVDLDEQRDIMKQFENNYMGDEGDGASPSSDFGF